MSLGEGQTIHKGPLVYCDYTFRGLQNTIVPAFNSITIDNIRNFFRKSRDYACAYKEGCSWLEADKQVKTYSRHKRVSEVESRH